MQHTAYHLAQANIATILAPLHDPAMSGFVAQLQTINALADRTPGFVWRLQDDGQSDATSIRPYEDARILINLSVWESFEALSNYVYRSQHATVMRDRRKWFEKSDQPTLVLWWVPAGHRPTVLEATERLNHLRQHGATPDAFSFSKPFPVRVEG
jgi:heme-degrading monooxygenase HmoA